MQQKFMARCLDCGYPCTYDVNSPSCPACGSLWREAIFDYPAIADQWRNGFTTLEFDLWRYSDLLPIHEFDTSLRLGEGGTPLLHARHLGTMLGNPNIFIKDERQNPTNSFKDRQASVSVAAYVEGNITELVCCSTGNVAISYSAYAARAGIRLWAYLTSLVPSEKMREVALFGTRVIKITGTYDEAKKIAQQFAEQRAIYYDLGSRSIPCVESMKTLAFEICEQLPLQSKNAGSPRAAWQAPDWYLQSVSGGLGPLGVVKGFQELQAMGLTNRLPGFGLVQVDGCAPMTRAWQQDAEVAEPVLSPRTMIATLATGDPGRTYTELYRRLRPANTSIFNSVSDEEAFRAMHLLSEIEGISMEPAAAVAFAGLIKLVRSGRIKPDESVVVNCTGHTMPVESYILGKDLETEAGFQSYSDRNDQEEGLLAALNNISSDRYRRILIADDEPNVRLLVSKILRSLGDFSLTEAANGKETLTAIDKEIPDLLILDLMMPEVDGFSVIDRLHSRKETSQIPIIVITAKELTRSEREFLKGRIQVLMQKGDLMNARLLQGI